jgi:hypothetical protein
VAHTVQYMEMERSAWPESCESRTNAILSTFADGHWVLGQREERWLFHKDSKKSWEENVRKTRSVGPNISVPLGWARLFFFFLLSVLSISLLFLLSIP